MFNLESHLSGWNPAGKQLFRTNTREEQFDSVDVASAVERVRSATYKKAPQMDGWGIPLHKNDSPEITKEYVVWNPEKESIGWFDTGFGTNGQERYVKIEDITETEIAHRLRFWTPGGRPSPPDVEFDLPPNKIEPYSRISNSKQESFFEEIAAYVRKERESAFEANWERYRELGFKAACKQSYAAGPFAPLGHGTDDYGTEGFVYQLGIDEEQVEEEVDLRDEFGLFYGSQVIVDAEINSDILPIPAELVSLSGATIIVEPLWEEVSQRPLVEKLLNESGPDIWLSPLLNPVPFQRQLDAISQVKQSRRKRSIITGNRTLHYSIDTFSIPEADIELNEYQQQALAWADAAEDIICIHGPPGTGKTRTLTAYVQHVVESGQSVLVAAHSNQAVDNLLVGDSTLSEPEEDTLHSIAQESDSKLKIARAGTNSQNQVVQHHYTGNSLKGANVIAATTSGAAEFEQNQFAVAVVDEATQASRPSTAIVLNCAKKLVLAGDHKQLPPYCADETMQEDELHISLFEYLLARYGDSPSVLLRTQYRMNQVIAEFPNQAFYDGALETDERNANWQVDDLKPLMGIDIQGTEQPEEYGNSRFNLAEAEAVAKQVKLLMLNGLSPDDIGVITAYSGQKKKINAAIRQLDIKYSGAVTVDTVDSFQGGEREAIIVSFVRSNDKGYSGFLEFPDVGPRRLNVALTRARKRLVLVGNWETLRTRAPHLSPDESCANNYRELEEFILDRGLMLKPHVQQA